MSKVFISSTSLDLPEYRAAAVRACNELGVGVVDMKDFEAMGVGATAGSLAKLDQANVYLGIFAYRYGYIEPPHDCSVTECEFDHAGARGLERLCFFVDPSFAWPKDRKERGQQKRLKAFKQRVLNSGVICARFTTPDNLHHGVYRALQSWLARQRRDVPRLPAPPRDFVGRDAVVAELLDAFDGGIAISGVRGQGGVGKTALALVLGERLAERYPDGQVFLDLRGFSPPPLRWQDGAAQVIRLFHPEERMPPGDEDLKERYRSVLYGRRLLLLLDNAADSQQVTPLLPPRSCGVLLTSRRHLDISGLCTRDLEVLAHDAAVSLLRSIAPRLTETDAAPIARQCGHLPQALRLAGATLARRKDLSADDYQRRLTAARLRGPLLPPARPGARVYPRPSGGVASARAQRWHARHFCAVIAAADKHFLRGGEAVVEALGRFDRAWPDAQAGFAWAAQRTAESDNDAAELCCDYANRSPYVRELRQHAQDRIAWLEQVVQAARRRNNPNAEGVALGNLGLAYVDLGQPQRAIDFYQQQLAIALEIGDRRGEANACWNLGEALAKLERVAEAIPLMAVCLRFEQEIGHPDAEKHTAQVEELRQRLAPPPEQPQ
jgi:tetratricopeptide (TPR) repeat protein